MRHEIEQYRIDNKNGLATWNLEQFAQGCGHKLAPVFPIFVVLTDGRLSAFYYAQPVVSVRPTVAPESEFEPRAFYETAKAIIGYSGNAFYNPLWLIEPQSKLANDKLLGKVGLKRKTLTVWEN